MNPANYLAYLITDCAICLAFVKGEQTRLVFISFIDREPNPLWHYL